MKKISTRTMGLLLAMASVCPLAAQAEMRIGYVDSTKIMELAPQAQEFKNILNKELEPRRNKLLKKQNEIKKLEESLIRDAAIMDTAEKLEIERDARSMKRDLRRMQEEFSEDVTIKRNEELMKLQKKVVSTIHEYAKKNDYDLIINESVVVYASNTVDITDEVLTLLDKGQ